MTQDPSSPPTVVILLSDKRSGSTIFQTEILNHPQVSGLDYSSHTYLESHHWLKAAVMMGMPPRLFAGGQTYPGYGSARNARTYMIDTITGNLPDFVPPAEDKALIFKGWEELCHHYAKPVFFEKSPQVMANWAAVTMLLDWMETTSFKVKLVGLVRNPLAVQHSSERLFGTAPKERQFGWAEIHRNLLALRQMLPAEQLMLMRHEEILADPQAQLADLCKFIGLAPDPQMGTQITDRTQNRWRSDPDYRLQLDPSVVQIARALGYDDADLANSNAEPPKSRARKRRRSLRQATTQFRDRVVRPLLMRHRSDFK